MNSDYRLKTDFVLAGVITDEVKDGNPTGFKTLRIGVSFCKGSAEELKLGEGNDARMVFVGPDAFNRKEGRRRATFRAYHDPIAIFTLSRTRANTKFQVDAFFASQAFFVSQMPNLFYGSVKPIDETKYHEMFGRYIIDHQKVLNKQKALENKKS